MSVKLSKGEVIVKQYDYSKTQRGALSVRSHLIVTNKRVIEEKVCDAKKNERVVRSEMPIDRAQYVTTSFKREGNALWLIMTIIGVLLAMTGPLSQIFGDSNGFALIIIGLIVAALGIVLFICVRKSTVFCVISSDKLVIPTLALSSVTKRFIFKSHVGTNKEIIKISVDPKSALEMVNEIGAAIIDAQNM